MKMSMFADFDLSKDFEYSCEDFNLQIPVWIMRKRFLS